jgi:hypothetical protein
MEGESRELMNRVEEIESSYLSGVKA